MVVFIDDILIYSRSQEEHEEHFRRVLDGFVIRKQRFAVIGVGLYLLSHLEVEPEGCRERRIAPNGFSHSRKRRQIRCGLYSLSLSSDHGLGNKDELTLHICIKIRGAVFPISFAEMRRFCLFSYSIIIANLLVPLIEKFTYPKPFGRGGERR